MNRSNLRWSARNKLFVMAVAVFIVLGVGGNASASPFGVYYDVLLDGTVFTLVDDGMGGLEPLFDVEGHLDTVLFDDEPGFVLNDLVPDPNFFLPGNDLIVTEMVTMDPNGTEIITIWVEGQDPNSPFPTPGAPLFVNELDPNSIVAFDVTGLEWPDFPGIVTGFDLIVTFGPLEVPIDPLFVDIFDGTDGGDGGDDGEDEGEFPVVEEIGEGSGFPIELFFGLDPADFVLPTGEHATDLHLEISVIHIPEPSSMMLMAIAGMALVGRRSVLRKRR